MEEESLFNGYKDPVWDDEKVLEMDNGDGCMYLTLLNRTLKKVKMVNFMLFIFSKKSNLLVSKTGNYSQIQGRHTVSSNLHYSIYLTL